MAPAYLVTAPNLGYPGSVPRAWWLLVLAGCGRLGFDAVPHAGDDASASTDAHPDVTAGLVDWFPLDLAHDQHLIPASVGAAGYAWSTTDVTPVAGRDGGALHFDGVGYQSYIIFPSSDGTCAAIPTFGPSLTVSAWARFDTLKVWNGYTLGDFAVAQGSSGGNGGVWGIGSTNGCAGVQTIGFELAFTQAARATRCGSTPLTTGTWYLLTGVYDATTLEMHVYLNGVLDDGAFAPGSTVVGASLNTPDMCPYIGSTGNQSQLIVGSVDDVRIYDRALSAAEVAQLYAHY